MEDTNTSSHEPEESSVPATHKEEITPNAPKLTTGSLAGISDDMGPLSGYGIYINTGYFRVVHYNDTPQGE